MQTDPPKRASQRGIVQDVLHQVGEDVEVASSIVVRLADKYTNMFGRQFNDTLTSHPRKSFQVHPYPWFAAGSEGVLAVQTTNHEIETLFINKVNRAAHRWYLPGGYAQPGPLQEGKCGLGTLTADEMDAAESGLLAKKKNSYIQVAKHSATYQQGQWQPRTRFDTTLEDCLQREIKEEIGVDITPFSTTLVQHKGIYLPYPLPVLENTYLVDCGNQKPPTKPDGQEVSKAFWVAATKITPKVDPNGVQFHYGQTLVDFELALRVNACVAKLRDKNFRLGSKQAALKLIQAANYPILWETVRFELGEQAHRNHLAQLQAEADVWQTLHQIPSPQLLWPSASPVSEETDTTPDTASTVGKSGPKPSP